MTIMSLYAQQLVRYPELGISLDFSKLPLDDAFLSSMQGRIDKAFADMKALESGAIANPDEKRMVGHYWLRNSSLAPTPELKAAIDGPLADVKAFGRDVLDGKITPPRAEQYSAALVIGIGGSALGPELVADAIPAAGLDMFFLDNTDPDGMYRVLDPPSGRNACRRYFQIRRHAGNPQRHAGGPGFLQEERAGIRSPGGCRHGSRLPAGQNG